MYINPKNRQKGRELEGCAVKGSHLIVREHRLANCEKWEWHQKRSANEDVPGTLSCPSTGTAHFSLFLHRHQKQNRAHVRREKKPLCEESSVLSELSSSASSSLRPFCTDSFLNQSITKSETPQPSLAGFPPGRGCGNVGQGLHQEMGSTVIAKTGFEPEAGGQSPRATCRHEPTQRRTNKCSFSPVDKLIHQAAHGPVFNSSSYSRWRCWSRKSSGRGRKWITGHPERPSQARRQLPRVVVPQLHATHADDLTHKTDFLPFQVFASQVLEILISVNYCGEALLKAGSIATDSREIDCHSSLLPVFSILISDSQDKEELNYRSQLALNEFKIHV